MTERINANESFALNVVEWSAQRLAEFTGSRISSGNNPNARKPGRKKGKKSRVTASVIISSDKVSSRKSKYFCGPGVGFEYPVDEDGDGQEQEMFSYSKEDMVDAYKPKVSYQVEANALNRLVCAYINSGREVDWVKVAKEMTKACNVERLPVDCFGMYYNSVDKSINSSKWSSDEEKKLVELARDHSEHDWIVIAEKLGTQRTPFQCLQHYQQALNTKLATVADWSADEERLLRDTVLLHGDRNWQRIASVLPGRTASQCQLKWRKSGGVLEDGIVNGEWNDEEERRLFLGVVAHEVPSLNDYKLPAAEVAQFVETHVTNAPDPARAAATPGAGAAAITTGKRRKYVKLKAKPVDGAGAEAEGDTSGHSLSWSRISEVVPGRDDTRCRDKWTTSLDPDISFEPFTEQEIALLSALVAEFGYNSWVTVSRYLKGRTDAQISLRWLKRTKSENKGTIKERETQGRKRKAVMPPLFGRANTSSLSVDHFVEVLEADL